MNENNLPALPELPEPLETFVRRYCDGLAVCCDCPQGGGMDENGDGEPPSCCGEPYDLGAELRPRIEQALAATPPCAEPVAWIRCGPDGKPDWAEDCLSDREEECELGFYMMPLFAYPPAEISEEQMRQALIESLRPSTAPAAPPEGFDFTAHLARQAAWSEKTFGPGARTAGVCDHIRKELLEVEADPSDSAEWIDVVILALDGAWRSGLKPDQIIAGIVAKQTKNEGRTWPDWRTADPNKAIEHDRLKDKPAKYWNDPTGAAESCIWDDQLNRYRRMTREEHQTARDEKYAAPPPIRQG